MSDTKKDLFVITFDVTNMSEENLKKLIIFLKSHRDISDWHSPFEGLFYVVSELPSDQIGDILVEFQSDVMFNLSRVRPPGNIGYLPQKSWDWLKKYKKVQDA